MQKLLYIALCDLSADGEVGIRNKVNAQIKVLSEKFDTYLATRDNFLTCVYHGADKIDKRALLSLEDIYTYLEIVIRRENISIIFLRYLRTNPWLQRFLKNMKQKHIKVLVEFPTIPYDAELEGRVELEEDRLYRNQLRRYVKYSTNYNGLKKVFGIPSVSIHNGINIEDISPKKQMPHEGIRMIAVASMNFWHGYDRLIRGMAEYYQTEQRQKVFLHLAGSGKEIPRYQDLIQSSKLENYVILEGIKRGKELDELYDRADIAVGTLGMFRINSQPSSPIKTKEYCARGLPMILGSHDLAFEGELPFLLRVSNDEKIIDIHSVVAFYQHFREVCDNAEIRRYAETNLTWARQFEKIYAFTGL